MNPIFLLGYLQLWNIMIGGLIHPTPHKLLSKTSQIYVVGFPVMVLFLWSSTCDKHNKHNLVIFEWGRDFSSEVSPFHFCWTNSLTTDHQDQKNSESFLCLQLFFCKRKIQLIRILSAMSIGNQIWLSCGWITTKLLRFHLGKCRIQMEAMGLGFTGIRTCRG
jgi:hypothetical protein